MKQKISKKAELSLPNETNKVKGRGGGIGGNRKKK